MNVKIGLCIIAVILTLYWLGVPILDQFELKFIDAKFAIRGGLKAGKQIILIEIDKKSIHRVGKWPWPRDRIAGLLDRIAAGKPGLVALDLLFSSPSPKTEEDRILAGSIRRAGNVILPYLFLCSRDEAIYQSEEDFTEALKGIANSRFNVVTNLQGEEQTPISIEAYGLESNVEEIAKASHGCGFFNVYLEKDGTVRRFPLVITAKGKSYFSMAVALLKAYSEAERVVLVLNGDRVAFIKVGDQSILVDDYGMMFLNYYGGAAVFDRCSASDLMEGKVDPADLEGRVVLVGGTSVGDFETRPTPLSPALSSVVIQATAIDNLFKQNYLIEGGVSRLAGILCISLFGLLISAALPRFPGIITQSGFAAACLLSFLFINFTLFSVWRVQTSTVYPLMSIVTCYAAISFSTSLIQEKRSRRVRRGLMEMAKTISSILDIDQLLPRVLDSVTEYAGADGGMLLMYLDQRGSPSKSQSLEIRVARNITGVQIGERHFIPLSRLISEAEKSGRAILLRHPAKHGKFKFEFWEDPSSIEFCLCIPIASKGKKLGVIYAESRSGAGGFLHRDLDILNSFAAQSAVAIENASLYTRIKQAEGRLREENVYLKREVSKHHVFREIVGSSEAMKRVFKLVETVLTTDTTVLIEGETGTGKELIARAIHYGGSRSRRPFIAQNCAALPETLLESELFGHVKGAFTGAVMDKKGLFEEANSGTIFLDEVGETSPAMQAKLLRVLEEGVIRPVGTSREIKVDTRVISATKHNLEEEVKRGSFREDLYFRLNVFPVRLPPLKERRADIASLAQHFLEKYSSRLGKRSKGFTIEAMNLLVSYDYPGNVRELENEIEKALALAADGEAINAGMLSEKIRSAMPSTPAKRRFIRRGKTLKEALKSIERDIISDVLKEVNGNMARAARALGLSRFTLYRKVDEFHLK